MRGKFILAGLVVVFLLVGFSGQVLGEPSGRELRTRGCCNSDSLRRACLIRVTSLKALDQLDRLEGEGVEEGRVNLCEEWERFLQGPTGCQSGLLLAFSREGLLESVKLGKVENGFPPKT